MTILESTLIELALNKFPSHSDIEKDFFIGITYGGNIFLLLPTPKGIWDENEFTCIELCNRDEQGFYELDSFQNIYSLKSFKTIQSNAWVYFKDENHINQFVKSEQYETYINRINELYSMRIDQLLVSLKSSNSDYVKVKIKERLSILVNK